MDELVKNGLVFEMGGGLLVDTAGNNTVTNNGATLTADHNGRANRGWLIDAANEYLDLGDFDLSFLYGTTGKGSFNIGFEFKADARNGRVLLSKYKSLSALELLISIESNTEMQIQLFDANADNYVIYYVPISLADGFHFLTVTYDASLTISTKITVAIDGANKSYTHFEIGTFTKVSNTDAKLLIGNTEWFPDTQYYNGAIDYININNKNLTLSEHQKLYNYWRSH